jgi:hypothetical protein
MTPLEQIMNIICSRIKSYLNINKVAPDKYGEALDEYIKKHPEICDQTKCSTPRVLDIRVFPTV